MQEKFTGVLLRTFAYNDNLRVADLFTESRGRCSFLIPLSASQRRKRTAVLFQPLSVLDFQSSSRRGNALPRISEASSNLLFSSLPFVPYKAAMALYLSEFLTRALREEAENPSLFSFLLYSLKWLDEATDNYSNFHLVFLIHLSRYIGIFPNIQGDSSSLFFDMQAGCYVSAQPLHSHFLMPEYAALLRRLLLTDYDHMHTISMNGKVRGEWLALLEEYFRLHIPDFPELKSAGVLRELFGS